MNGTATLEIDVGNSRLKWRLLGADGVVCRRGTNALAAMTDALPAAAECAQVRVVSVAGPEQDQVLQAELASLGHDAVAFARSGVAHGRLRSGYRSPERLGADRWLAMVAAVAITDEAFAVLDAGSALTLDLVAPDGEHLGGWIVPGLALMRQTLLNSTAGVRFDDHGQSANCEPGTNTAEAVRAGTLVMARDFAAARIGALRERWPSALLFVTGGDGPSVSAGLEGAVESRPDLVLDGLVELLG